MDNERGSTIPTDGDASCCGPVEAPGVTWFSGIEISASWFASVGHDDCAEFLTV
jgi:hypothetical protein